MRLISQTIQPSLSLSDLPTSPDDCAPMPLPEGRTSVGLRERRTALIVDDNTLLREMYRVLFEAEDYGVVEANNGAEALLWLQQEAADIILLDLEMPVMDGRSFLEYRRHDARIRQIPVLVVSGRLEDARLRQTLVHLGADQVLQKPAGSAELLGAVEALLAQHPTPDLPSSQESREEGGRRDARVCLRIPVLVQTEVPDYASGQLHDLSAGGLGLALSQHLAPGGVVTVRLGVDRCTLSLEGVVRWTGVYQAAPGCHHGVRLAVRQGDAFPLTVYASCCGHTADRGLRPPTWNLGRRRLKNRAA